MRQPTANGHLKFVKETLFLAYLAMGLYGATWISDDYDKERLYLFAYAGIPLTVLYYGLVTLYPEWSSRFRQLSGALTLALCVIYASGHILLVNALSGEVTEVKRSLALNQKIVIIKAKRGRLDHLYTARW